MGDKSFKKLKVGFNGRLHKALRENLKYLEPKGASKRILFQVPHTYEKAIKEIHFSQEKFNSEREKIRSLLNTPIKSTKDVSNLPSNQSKNTRKIIKSTSSFILKKNQNIKVKKLEKNETSLNNSGEKLEKIEEVISNCEKFNRSNKLFIKQCKDSKKLLNVSFREINKDLDSISRASSEIIKFETQRKKIESEIFKSLFFENFSNKL